MKLSNKDWISKCLAAIDKKTKEMRSFFDKALNYLEHEYHYTNKLEYLRAIENCCIPTIFCLDIENREISYLHFGKIKFSFNLKKGIFVVSKDRITANSIGQLSAVMSGIKQIACKTTSEKRRHSDGTYKGIDKTHETKIKGDMYNKAAAKIAKNRRQPDGTYKGTEKMLKTKLENNVFFVAANKTAKTRREADGGYSGVTIRHMPEQVVEILKEKWPGYTYLETEMRGSSSNARYMCDRGHIFKTTILRLKKGEGGCQKCIKFIMEQKCREIFERILGNKFPKARPDWLRNPITSKKLELDGYCEALHMAFEFDGPTHFYPLHGKKVLRDTIYRDRIKEELCKKHGIALIRIDYREKDMERAIEKAIGALNGENNQQN